MPTPVAEDEASTGTPLGSSIGPKTRRAANHSASQPTPADRAFTTASNKTLPGVDPSWGPSATPAQQARNILRTQKNEEKRQQQAAKAQQTAATAARSTQNKGALQSALERFNLSPAASAKPAAPAARANATPANDLRERMLSLRANATPASPQAPQARTPDQKAADVGEQPLSGSVGPNGRNVPADVARIQRALVRNGAMNPANATGYIGTATLDATRAFQKKTGLKIDGFITPGGPTEAALMDGTIEKWRAEQERKAFSKGIQVADGGILRSDLKKPGAIYRTLDFLSSIPDRINNPDKNHGLDKNQTTMTPSEAARAFRDAVAIETLDEGGQMLSKIPAGRTSRNFADLVTELLDPTNKMTGDIMQRIADVMKQEYLDTQYADEVKNKENRQR